MKIGAKGHCGHAWHLRGLQRTGRHHAPGRAVGGCQPRQARGVPLWISACPGEASARPGVVDKTCTWGGWLQGQGAQAPQGQGRRGKRENGGGTLDLCYQLAATVSRARGWSWDRACLPPAGGTACTCVGKLPASQRAILSPAPFMAPEVSGGGWRTALGDVNGNAEHGRAAATTPSLVRASAAPGSEDVSLGRLAAHPACWLRARPPLGLLLGPWGSRAAVGAMHSPAEPQWAERRGWLPDSNAPAPPPGSQLCSHPDPLNELSEQPSHLPPTPVALLTLRRTPPGRTPLGCWPQHAWGVGAPLSRQSLFGQRAGRFVHSVCPEQAQGLAAGQQEHASAIEIRRHTP